jgi:hypothetical protein
MAIRAIIEGGRVDITPEDVKELAKGEKDEHGRAFEIIKLMAIGQDGRGAGSRFHISGYQDTFISVMDSGTVKIQHGNPGQGTINFERNKLGRLIAEVVNTPWNLETLAAQVAAGDKQWKIMDDEQERMVRDASKKVRVSEDTIKAKAAVKTEAVGPRIDAETELKHQIEMSNKVEAIQEKTNKAELKDDIQESFPGKNKLLAEIADMSYSALKQRAVSIGVDKEIRAREELIAGIMLYEAKKSKGELAVE